MKLRMHGVVAALTLTVFVGVLLLPVIPGLAQTTVDSFAFPFGVARDDSTGYLYVTDSYRHCIIQTKIDGDGWTSYGTEGDGRNEFKFPKGIYLDNSGYLYVADSWNNRIVKTRMDGSYWEVLGGVMGMGQGQFAGPRGVYLDEGTGYLYVADSGNNRVVKTKMDGSGWKTIGTQGTGLGELYLPAGVVYDSSTGHLIIADSGNCRLVVTDIDGSFWNNLGEEGKGTGQFGYPRTVWRDSTGDILVADTRNNRIVKTDTGLSSWQEFGVRGYHDGQFLSPRGLVGESDGDIFVADCFNHRLVQTKLDGSGWTSIAAMYDPDLNISAIQPPAGTSGQPVTIIGNGLGDSQGSGKVEFNDIEAEVTSWSNEQIECSVPESAQTGDVVVTTSEGNRTNSVFFPVLDKDSLFRAPFGVAYDSESGLLYVTDTRHNRVVEASIEGENFASIGSGGFGEYQFARPTGIFYDAESEGYVYVSDTVNNRIDSLTMEGSGWMTLGVQGQDTGELYFPRNVYYDHDSENVYIADAGNNRIIMSKMDGSGWQALGSTGSGEAQFMAPKGIAYDPETGYVYVSDSLNHRIVRTKIDGSGWSTLGEYGSGAFQFCEPRSIYLEQGKKQIYVADTNNHRIVKTEFDGSNWEELGSIGSGDGQFYYPRGIWYDSSSGYVFVADSGNDRIVRTTMDGSEWTVLSGGPSLPFRWSMAEGTTRPGFNQYVCLMNTGDKPAEVSITSHLRTGAGEDEKVVVAPNTRYTVDVNELLGSGEDNALNIVSDSPLVVERPMYFNRNGIDGGHTNLGLPEPGTVFLFPEGTTRRGFEEYVTLQNPSDDTATVDIEFMVENGENESLQLSLDPRSRETVKVNDIVGLDLDLAVEVKSDVPICAERPIYFRYRDTITGGHVTAGLTNPSNTFYFAEGTTRNNFDEWLCLQNPGDEATSVDITYFLEDGTTRTQEVIVEAKSRRTVDVKAEIGEGHDVGVEILSEHPIAAERPIYFLYGSGWDGGHDVVGITEPKVSFYFAEGTTRDGFQEYLTMTNPHAEEAQVVITYYLESEEGGTTQTQTVSLPPSTRDTISVNEAIGAGKDVSVKIESSIPIVAERPMYFNYQNTATGGSCVTGYAI